MTRKKELLQLIYDGAGAICLITIHAHPSSNPSGDTGDAIRAVKSILESYGVPYETISPKLKLLHIVNTW